MKSSPVYGLRHLDSDLGRQDMMRTSVLPLHMPPFLLFIYSCASLLSLFFYCYALAFSSSAFSLFIPHFLLSFGELLSYLFLSCGLERKQTGTEQKGAAIPLPNNRHALNSVIFSSSASWCHSPFIRPYIPPSLTVNLPFSH